MSCIACVAECHYECYESSESGCCCPKTSLSITAGKTGNASKADDEVTDPESTGRKRAAVLYPLSPGMACEWRGLKAACGGAAPIIGCVEGIATNRHHGPDKSTLNNESGNVHRICATCHNRWHTLNDPLYKTLKTLPDAIPHDPFTKATEKEQLENEMRWVRRPADRIKDET